MLRVMLQNLCILNSNPERLKIMKKIYIALAALAAVTLISCEREKSFGDERIGENALVLSMRGGAPTRAAEEVAVVKKGATINFGQDENGTMLILEETIQDLNATWAPATKGTPAYTENVGVLYEKMGAHVGSSDYEFYSMDNSEGSASGSMVNGGWRYVCDNFTGWPANATDESSLDFYLWMPKADNGIKTTPAVEYGKNDSDSLTITFGYKSPATAAAQKDLIFAARSITKAEALENRVNGVPVLFNHALTGVKFAIANYDANKMITIKSISFNGLYDEGTCTITPAKEKNYRDKPTQEYSSGDGRVVWTLSSTRGTTPLSSGSFGAPVKFEKKTTNDGTTTGGAFTDYGNYPDSFAEGGNENNLNDGNASQTFWLIPQTMSDDVTITIVYTYGSETEKTGTFEFGKALKNASTGTYVQWKAGELRTYTIRVDDVNVTITDQFTATEKNNVVITNTGNTDAYIRAAIIGQWVDQSGNPVFGYTDFKSGESETASIPSWYQDFTSDKVGDQKYFGYFTGLPGTGWVAGSDGYYYYTSPVAPGGHPNALFTTYTVKSANIPKMRVGGKYVNTTLLIEVSTQAISAKKRNSSQNYSTYTEAWANAQTISSEAQTIAVN